jgi:hypothetical protein
MVFRSTLRMYCGRLKYSDKVLVGELVQSGMSFQTARLSHAKLYRLHERSHYYMLDGTVPVIRLGLMDEWRNRKCEGRLWLGKRGWMD